MEKLLEEAIQQLKAKDIFIEYLKQISSGKEAYIYLVSYRNQLYALKVYKDYLKRSFKHNEEYLAGKHLHRHSERKAVLKRNHFGKDLTHKLWVKREYYLMVKLFKNGIPIPKPIEMTQNSILMEYIGDYSSPAPKLKDVKLTRLEAVSAYDKIIKSIETMYKCGIVHGDLSHFNILYWNNSPWIIDFPQALDIRNNPNAEKILERDKYNINKWFKTYSNA